MRSNLAYLVVRPFVIFGAVVGLINAEAGRESKAVAGIIGFFCFVVALNWEKPHA